ncbi:MAG: L-seryl-tRNA(Sec) selenium transferase [Myxococcota bacterium]|nr:L-seryl-tRNA(Sec) selenium transferase [Myxococcota bacterium]
MEPELPVKTDPRRALPAVDRLARQAGEGRTDLPRWALAQGARETLDRERERLGAGAREPAPEAELVRRAVAGAERLVAPHPRRVVNATGIVLHTNLGRAPLAPGAAAAVAAAAAGYSDLELDLASGQRGDRLARVSERLARLSGAEAAFAVNNCAAAILLVLDTLGRGREALVSRGELVEIGGSFRVPEIMERAGVRLKEVGSTNRTHPADYERGAGPDSALLLKVHRSNFEVRGFVSEVGLPELAAIGRERGLPVVEDLGSGTLVELPGLPAEAFAPARLAQGADVVCFSGDKLLGGPQAGIILGSAEQVHAMRRNPLARALRLDKLSLAALDWTLGVYLEGRAREEIPVLRQLCEAEEALEKRARALAERLDRPAGAGMTVKAEAQTGFVGGGSVPGFELPGWVVALEPASGAETIAARLRGAPVPVLPRVRDGRLLLDVRTLLPGDEADVEAALAHALQERR